jgi:hypothetical protein
MELNNFHRGPQTCLSAGREDIEFHRVTKYNPLCTLCKFLVSLRPVI